MKSLLLSLSIIIYSLPALSFFYSDQDSMDMSAWMGEWSGELEIYNSSGLKQTIPMKIKNFKTDIQGVYGWYLIYGSDEEKGTRAYYLKAIDAKAGHFQIDEKNGIFLDSYLIGNRMISTFEVEHSLITSIYTLVEDGSMLFEIIAANTNASNVSGGSVINEEEIPKVHSYISSAYQRANLQKMLD